MTVLTSTNIAGPFTGDGANTTFDFTFKVFSAADLQVILTDANDVETTLTLNVHYSVSLAGDLLSGTVTYPLSGDPLPATSELRIVRVVDYTQGAAFQNQGGFYPKTHENAYDKATMQIQQLKENLDRAPKFSISSGLTGVEMPTANPGYYLAFNSTGTGLQAIAPTAAQTNSAIIEEYFSYADMTISGGHTSVTTDTEVTPGIGHILVFVSGVAQRYGTDYDHGATNDVNTIRILNRELGSSDYIFARIGILDSSSAESAANISYTPAGTGAVATNVKAKLDQWISVKDFGAVGDGVTDNGGAFLNAINTGADKIYVPAGVYYFSTAPVWTGLANVTFIGDGGSSSLLRWDDGRFCLKSPSFVTFEKIGFSPNPSDSLYPEVFVTNFTTIKFDMCRFEGFGSNTTVNKAGSTCLWLYADDGDSATVAAGDCSGATITNCEFVGNGRKTNFGVRVYTEWVSPAATINVNTRISNCTFSGFNWNAVEIAGPQTAFCTVSNCTALLCGLVPFDLDKGCHDCIVTDCTIRRLLGNVDTDVNPNTGASLSAIVGQTPSGVYGYNNIVQNIVGYLLRSDIESFGNRCTAVSVAYVRDCVIKNVTCYIDAVPSKPAADGFAFAMVSYETISNCVVENINTANASAGIMQTSSFNAAMTYSGPNYFRNIKNVGTMKAEFITQNAGNANGSLVQCVFENLNMKTDLSEPSVTGLTYSYGVLCQALYSSLNFAIIRDSHLYLDNGSAYFLCHRIANVGLENVAIIGIPVNDRFIHSEGSTNPSSLGLNGVYASSGNAPIDLSTLLQHLDQTTTITGAVNEFGVAQAAPVTLFSSAQPTYPPVNFWNQNIRVERLNKLSSSYVGWTVANVATTPAWKTYGTVSA